MKIGVDAKWYFSGPPSTQTVLQNLLPRLFHSYPQHEWIVFLDKKDKQYGFPFQQPNIRTHYVWAGINMLSNLLVLPWHNRRHRPDIMLFQTFPALFQKTISIAFIHDVLFNNYPQYFTWKERLYFLPLRWLAPKANRIIVTSRFVASELIRFNYRQNPSEIDIVPLGISADFKPANQMDPVLLKVVREKFGLPASFLLFVGRLNARKNIESLLKAIPLLHDTNMKLVIVGEAEGKAVRLKKILADPRLQKRVVTIGKVTPQELPMIYAMATVFCFPSFAEGFGLPPLEAMAAGIPVVVSHGTSLQEVCGDAPVYVDPNNVEGIANALNHLLENSGLYDEKREKGLQQARKYNWEKTAQGLMRSISTCIKQ